MFSVNEPFAGDQELQVFSLHNSVVAQYLVYLLKAINPLTYVVSLSTPRIDVERLLELQLALPTYEEQQSIAKHLKLALAEINNIRSGLTQQIDLYTDLETTILQEMTSGTRKDE